jgi:hypothetical protein
MGVSLEIRAYPSRPPEDMAQTEALFLEKGVGADRRPEARRDSGSYLEHAGCRDARKARAMGHGPTRPTRIGS